MTTNVSPQPPIDAEYLRQWIGRTETMQDMTVPWRAAQWTAMLDRYAGDESTDLPLLAHWMCFTPLAPQSEIGADGHPKLGGFLPPIPLPRRMWAGSRLNFIRALGTAQHLSKETTITDLAVKNGSQGALIFLTLRHRISDAGRVAIDEEQDIVYRAASTGPDAAASPAGPVYDGPAAEWEDQITPDETLMFRYSALTFNAHRIHYDLPYTKGVEDYPGLVVQGPLTAALLINRATAWMQRRPSHYSFRGVSPLFANEPVGLCGWREKSTLNLMAIAPGNRIAMKAVASFAEDA